MPSKAMSLPFRLKLNKNLSLFLGGGIVILLFLMLIISLFYTPYDPNEMSMVDRFQSPGGDHILGTDNFGRDILSRVMFGTRTAFLVGTISIAIALITGTFLGALAGYFRGYVDEIIMRFIDVIMAFPGILIAIMVIAVFGPGIVNTMIALGTMTVPTFARICRSGYIQYRELEFVEGAKSVGASSLRIIFVHILPNVIPPLIIASSVGFATAILTESSLSYLGLGVQPPYPSWGRMLSEAQSFYRIAPWYAIVPGTFITLSVLGFNFIGRWIERLVRSKRLKVFGYI